MVIRRIVISIMGALTGAILLAHGTQAQDPFSLRVPKPSYLGHQEHWRKICPPGYRVPIGVGATVLHVDIHDASLSRFPNELVGDRCPSAPVFADWVWFTSAWKIMGRNRLRDFRLDAPRPGKFQGREPVRSAPESRRVVPGGGEIDDISQYLPSTDRERYNVRAYRLQQVIADDGRVPPAIEIQCSGVAGKVPGRSCSTTYLYRSELVVHYRTRIDTGGHFGARSPTRDGTLPEPDGLMEIDARVRAFIEELKRKP